MSFGELARDAIRYARDGFEVTPLAAAAAQGYRGFYRGFDEWQAVYGGLELGDVLVQEPLARLIELLAADGPDAYYRGPVADAIAAALGRYGGLMTTDDLAAHAGRWDAPLRRAVPRRRGRRAPAAHPGRGGARDPAHPRRVRPRRAWTPATAPTSWSRR